MKRKPPIAHSLMKNSRAAMFAAIEIHNKPLFQYRYEVVVLLIINAWELLLKAYIYRFLKKVKLIQEDGKSKPFLECLRCVASNNGKDFKIIEESLAAIYKYRNSIAHYHVKNLDVIIFSLIAKNLILYKEFLKMNFKVDLTVESDLILMPIGFKKPISPLDFLSKDSYIKDSPPYIKEFLGSIVESTARLSHQGVEDSILVDYSINLTNEKKIKNADIVAGITNTKNAGINIIVQNVIKETKLSEEEKSTLRNFNIPPKTNEEQIANWIALNTDGTSYPPEDVMWKLYSERKRIKVDDYQRLKMIEFSILRDIPVFFWLEGLNRDKINELLEKLFKKQNYRTINTTSLMLYIACFVGKGCFTGLMSKTSTSIKHRLDIKAHKDADEIKRTTYLRALIDEFKRLHRGKPFNEDSEDFRTFLEDQLSLLVLDFLTTKADPIKRKHAQELDCFLYAPDGRYHKTHEEAHVAKA